MSRNKDRVPGIQFILVTLNSIKVKKNVTVPYEYTHYVWILFVSLIFTCILTAYGIRHRTAPAGLCIIIEYSGLNQWLNKRNIAILTLIPLIFGVFMLTNDYHHFVWKRIHRTITTDFLPLTDNKIFTACHPLSQAVLS
ncbi:MAG: hypothetical protein OMM_15267, partial [Candidatus Magnetoglobus multicellularis str. Araruama]